MKLIAGPRLDPLGAVELAAEAGDQPARAIG